MHGKFFNSSVKVQGIVDLFEFVEHFQVIVDIGSRYYVVITNSKNEGFQSPTDRLYSLLVLNKWFALQAMFQDSCPLKQEKKCKIAFKL